MTSFGTAVLAEGLRRDVREGRMTLDQATALLTAAHEHDERVTVWSALGELFRLARRAGGYMREKVAQ